MKSQEDLERIAAAVKVPLVLGGAGDRFNDAEYLAGRGVRVWSSGHEAFTATVQALYDTMKAVRDGTPPGQLQNVASNETMARLTQAAGYEAATRTFIG